MAIYDFFVSRNNGSSVNANTYVGHKGRLFYDDTNGLIRISDGITPGGAIVQNPALAASSIAPPPAPFEGMLWYNPTSKELWAYHAGSFRGTINPATPTTLGGIKAGPGANVAVDGTLTIDTTGLPLSFGNLTAIDTTLKTTQPDSDLVLETNGSGNVELVGNVNFYSAAQGHTGIPYYMTAGDGQVSYFVSNVDATSGAVKIIGSTSRAFYPPVNTGVMLHITGQTGDASRLYNDGLNNFAAFVGRRINGNLIALSAVQAGDEIIRISSTGYNGTTVPGSGSARIVYQAIETYTPTATGSNISLWTCAVGSNTLSKIVTVDSASGLTATRATIQGNLTVSGNLLGNITTTTASINNLSVSGNVSYNVAVNNGTVTQITSKATAVTCNGRTGQITTSNGSIAKGEAVTFTVNNSYITSVTDVPVVAFQSGATTNSYSVSVTRVQVGSFNITITNNGVGPLTDTIVINFAVIKVG